MATGSPLTHLPQPIPGLPQPVFDRPKTTVKPKKKLIRRTDVDRSQVYRRSFQAAFFVLNLWLGAKFYFWVRQFEVGVVDANLHRPPGVEGWLPIAGLMNLKYWLLQRRNSSCASGRILLIGHFSGDGLPVSQGVLQLALPRRHDFRISLARRQENV